MEDEINLVLQFEAFTLAIERLAQHGRIATSTMYTQRRVALCKIISKMLGRELTVDEVNAVRVADENGAKI